MYAERDHSTPYFTPILTEYATNQEFLCKTIDIDHHCISTASTKLAALLNSAGVSACCVRVKLKHPALSAKTQGPSDSSSKAMKQAAASRGRKTRRNSAIKT